jgi:2-polyprenyl-6-methoxyphenol hydroxylase-like FAD-dependent oxidoreductase
LGVAEAVKGACVPLQGRRAHLPDGREHFTPYSRNGDQIWAVERASLHRVLLDAAQATPGVRLCFGEAVEVVEPDGPAWPSSSSGVSHSVRRSAATVPAGGGVAAAGWGPSGDHA